jgi:hypothetical protein
MLAALQREIGFEFVIVSGPGLFRPGPDLNYRFVPWSPAIEGQIADMFDVGIMPLKDDPLQRAKCGAKLLQYMAAGLPVVASPVGINSSIVRPGENGYLAGEAEAWRSALQQLAADPALRSRLGSAGRSLVERDYSLGRWLPAWLEVLEETAGGEAQPLKGFRPAAMNRGGFNTRRTSRSCNPASSTSRQACSLKR